MQASLHPFSVFYWARYMNSHSDASGVAEPLSDELESTARQSVPFCPSKSSDIHEVRVARHMAAHGLRCVPLVKDTKVPRKDFTWKTMATTNSKIIEAEFIRGRYDVGVVPGSGGYVVLDVDNKNGKRGDLSIELLEEEHGHLSNTLTQYTKSGGRHLWFRLPEGIEVGNSDSMLKARLGEGHGIDVRAHVGLVVVQADGYAFDTPDDFFDESLVHDVPTSLLGLLRVSVPEGADDPVTPIDSVVANRGDAVTNRGEQPEEVSFYGEQADREVWQARVEECMANRLYQPDREGERNQQLIRFVGELKRLQGCPTSFPEDVFKRWHQIAQTRGSKSPVEHTVSAARHLWNSFNPAKSPVVQAAAIAKGQKIDGYEAPDQQHALYFIYQQLMDSEGISYVPQRHLCSLLDCHKQTVAKYQRQLCDDGYLVLVEDYKAQVRCKRFKVIDKIAVEADS